MTKEKIEPYLALKSIMEITSIHTGKNFLKIICNELKKLFAADIVFITQAIEINPTYNVRVLYSTLDSFAKEFNLDDTPCKLVFNNKIIVIDKDVSLNFKKDAKFKMESFLGLPMYNNEGNCFGHIAIMSKNKKAFEQVHIEIAKIFLGRIESETRRQILEKENEKIRKELYLMTITDSLTNLYNRRYFNQKIEEVFALVKRNVYKAAISSFDIDNFKLLNDTYGHNEGDYILKNIGKILNEHSRKDIDFIFRIGGEEFSIISLNNSKKEMKNYLLRLMEYINLFFKDKPYKVTLSAGVSKFKKEYSSWENIYKKADKRMYKAKKEGKNRVIIKG